MCGDGKNGSVNVCDTLVHLKSSGCLKLQISDLYVQLLAQVNTTKPAIYILQSLHHYEYVSAFLDPKYCYMLR